MNNSASYRNSSSCIRSLGMLQERPQKKARIAASADIVKTLVDRGIAEFAGGKFDDAEIHFSEALCFSKSGCTSAQVEFTAESLPSSKESASCGGAQEQEYDEGLSVYKDVMRIHDLQHQDSITATLLYNMGQVHSSRGRYRAAKACFEGSLSRCKQNPKDTRISRIQMRILCNLGYCNYRLQANTEAKECYQKALSFMREFCIGEVEVAACLNSLGVLQFHTGQMEFMKEASEMLQESLALYLLASNGRMSIKEATVLNNIGRVLYLRGERAEAIVAYKRSLQIRRQSLGDNAVDTAATLFNLAQCYRSDPETLNEAMKCYEEFVKILSAVPYSDIQADLAHGFRGIAEICYERSEMTLALRFYQKAIQIQRISLGSLHPEVASTLNKLGNVCFELKDFAAALKYYTEGLELEQAVLAPDHTHIMISLLNIGHVYKTLGHHREALIAYNRAHHIQVNTYGPDSLQAAEMLSNIGLVQYHAQDFESAFESYQEALRIRRDHHGTDDHPEIASTLNSIGLVLFKQEMFALSERCFAEGLRIRRSMLGPNHREVAILWYNLATVHFETGKADVAIECYKETLRVEREAMGAHHPDVVLTLQHLGQVYQQLGHLDEALKYFQDALDIEKQMAKDGDTVFAGKLLNQIGNAHLQQGNTADMMTSFAKASRIYLDLKLPISSLVIAGYIFYGLSKIHPPCAEAA